MVHKRKISSIEELAAEAKMETLPRKSKELYDVTYDDFLDFLAQQKTSIKELQVRKRVSCFSLKSS